MRTILTVLSVLLLVLAVIAGPALAQVPPHDHLLTVPGTGEVIQVGPPRCDLGETVQDAFLEFHFNVHLGEPSATGGLTITPDFC